MGQYFTFVNTTREVESIAPLPFNFNLPWVKDLDQQSAAEQQQIFAFVYAANQWANNDELVAIGDNGTKIFPRQEQAARSTNQSKPAAVREEGAAYQVMSKQTFSDYFKLSAPPDEIAQMLGCHYRRSQLVLPKTQVDLQPIAALQQRLHQNLTRIGMHNETARREFLIAPVLAQLLDYVQAKVVVERSLYVNNQLQGSLDYYLEADQGMIVIEAKQGDLQRGFHQLMAELVALDQHPATKPSATLYGAVTIGDVWQFGRFDRDAQLITQDIDLYTVPTNLPQLLQILIGILSGETK